MMFWLPSWFLVESTTEGDEYALEVTQVQWRTKRTRRTKRFPTTRRRGPIPKIPFREEEDFEEEEEAAAAFLAAFLDGGVGGVLSVVDVPVEGVEKRARTGSASSISISGV